MIFISLKRKTIGLIVFFVILSLVAITVFTAVKVIDNQNKYDSVLAMTQMFEDTNFIAYISDVETMQKKPGQKLYVEVFDISKGQVIIAEPANIEIQNEASNYIKTIKGLYTKVMPFPEKGYIIRIPFETPIKVKQKLLKKSGIKIVDSVFIIVSEKEAPIMLILDSQEKPYFYTFNAGIQPLLDYIKLVPSEPSMAEPEDIAPTEIETEVLIPDVPNS